MSCRYREGRGGGSTVDKYVAAAHALRGKRPAKGTPLFQDFVLLFDLRNAIMHTKPDDSFGLALTERLTRRKLALGPPLPWLNRLEAPDVALWAVHTSWRMMLYVLSLDPTRYATPMHDPLQFLRAHLEKHPGLTSLLAKS